MKKWLTKQHFEDNEELTASVNEWLKSLWTDFYEEGTQKLVNRYDKHLNLTVDYVKNSRWVSFSTVLIKFVFSHFIFIYSKT